MKKREFSTKEKNLHWDVKKKLDEFCTMRSYGGRFDYLVFEDYRKLRNLSKKLIKFLEDNVEGLK